MGRDLSHVEASELLGAYALDAIEGDERAALERHTEVCAACQQEVLGHREVAGLLTPGWAKPPEEVWERIAAALEETPPPLDMAPVIAMRPAAPKRTRGFAVAAMVAAVAAAVIAVLGVKVVDDGRRINELAQGAHADELQRTVNAALLDRDARQVDLRSSDGALSVQAVLLRDGTGYLVRDNLPRLSPDRTYQLWALVGTSRVSIGVLGADPNITGFKANGPLSGLAVTNEAAGGVVSTVRDPVVVGRVQDA
jgi:anti-sigma factor RsiW